MRCYNHYDRDAVCICRSCGKALCRDCADSEKDSIYLYCKNSRRCRNIEKLSRLGYKFFEMHDSLGTKIIKFIFIAAAVIVVGYGISLIMPPAPLPPVPMQ